MGPNGATGAVYLAHRDLPQRPVALTRAPGVSRRARFATMDRDQARSPPLDGFSTGPLFGFRGRPNI